MTFNLYTKEKLREVKEAEAENGFWYCAYRATSGKGGEFIRSYYPVCMSDVVRKSSIKYSLHAIPLTPELMREIGFVDVDPERSVIEINGVKLRELEFPKPGSYRYELFVTFPNGPAKLFTLVSLHELQDAFSRILERPLEVDLSKYIKT